MLPADPTPDNVERVVSSLLIGAGVALLVLALARALHGRALTAVLVAGACGVDIQPSPGVPGAALGAMPATATDWCGREADADAPCDCDVDAWGLDADRVWGCDAACISPPLGQNCCEVHSVERVILATGC